MAISALSGVNAASASLSMEDLMKVMLTELTQQDPMKPVENKDFMAQIAQFSSLDASRQLNSSIEQLLKLQSLSQSVGLLGRTVDAQTATGVVTGQVSALTTSGTEPQLTLQTVGGGIVPGITIGQIQNVR